MRNLQELCLRCETVKKQFDGLDTIDILSMLCTMIDRVAFITGMSTEELMKLISPVITEVHIEQGPIYISKTILTEDEDDKSGSD